MALRDLDLVRDLPRPLGVGDLDLLRLLYGSGDLESEYDLDLDLLLGVLDLDLDLDLDLEPDCDLEYDLDLEPDLELGDFDLKNQHKVKTCLLVSDRVRQTNLPSAQLPDSLGSV